MTDLVQIVSSYFGDEPCATAAPQATFVVGPICAGKTTHIRENSGKQFVLLDAGDAYIKLNGGSWSGFGAHLKDETEQACVAIVGRAIMQSRSIVCELLIDSDQAARVMRAIQKELVGLGYEISIVDLDCDQETARKRNETRAKDNISSYHTTSYHLNAFIQILQAKRSGELELGRCDVCNSEISYPQGHLLTTRQVVGTPRFWSTLVEMQSDSLEPRGVRSFKAFLNNPRVRVEYAARFAGEASPWLVCDLCVSMFDVDRSVTHEHAKQWWECIAVYNLPGVGAVPLSEVKMVDSRVPTEAHQATSDASSGSERRWWQFWKGPSGGDTKDE